MDQHGEIRLALRSPEGVALRVFLRPWHVVRHLAGSWDLIRQFAWREVVGRYKGSYLGLLWSVLNPLLLLAVYTYVFSVVLRMKWGNENVPDKPGGFAIPLFAGLIMYTLFAEVTNSAPALILTNPSYVKRVVFPLEILPVARVLSNLVNLCIAIAILIVSQLFIVGTVSPRLPLCIIPILTIALVSLGLAYFLASLGVFVRDVGQAVNLAVLVLFFLSPIFYPIERIPEWAQTVSLFNPLAVVVEDARRFAIADDLVPYKPANWPATIGMLGASVLLAWTGFLWFIKSKRAFADVI